MPEAAALETAAGNHQNVQQASLKHMIYLPLPPAGPDRTRARLPGRNNVCEGHVGGMQAWLLLARQWWLIA